ncbi:MAG: hypothetical protein OXC62_06995 [Aestuariivita sp.]|nr:hypothetical protein [Aestuariivita sp.]
MRNGYYINTVLNTPNLHVLDSFTGMPIGCVLHSSENNGGFRDVLFLRSNDGKIKPPEGGWRLRYDHAAREV